MDNKFRLTKEEIESIVSKLKAIIKNRKYEIYEIENKKGDCTGKLFKAFGEDGLGKFAISYIQEIDESYTIEKFIIDETTIVLPTAEIMEAMIKILSV